MINKILDCIVKRLENKSRKKFGGELIMLVVYKPDNPKPNVIFNVHPDIRTVLINDKCRELADIIRDEWAYRNNPESL